MSFYDDASLVFLPSGGAGKDGKAYSMKPTNGDGDFTFSRGSNLTATRVDSNGLIEKGRENLLTYSNDFSNASWNKSETSVTSGQSGYDGSLNAWSLIPSTTNTNSHRMYKDYSSSGGVFTSSIYVKANGYDFLKINNYSASVVFDVSTGNPTSGTIVSESGSPIDSNIISVGNGWYRVDVTKDSASGNLRTQLFVQIDVADSSFSGDGTSGVLIQDAQLELGLAATEYIESGATTGLAGILEDSPRFDYSGGASCGSLLLEPSRTTILPYSEYFQGWHSDNNVSYSVNDTTSPEGLTNATKVTATGTSGAYFRHTTSATVGDNTFSIFAKYDDCQYICFRILLFTGGDEGFVWFDIQNGVKAGSTGSVMEYDIEDYGNGWYRCYVVHNVDAADLNGYAFVFLTNEDEGTLVTNGTSAHFYGGQWEAGSYPTSYIPNHSGGSVTRNAEQIVNTNISSIVNTSNAYTIFFDFTRPNADYTSSWQIVGIDNGGYTSRLKIIQRPNFDQFRVNVYDGSTNVTSNEIDNSAQNKIAVFYDGGTSYKIFTNGTLLETLTCGAINGTRLISGENGTQKTIENHKQTLIFPTALSTTDCEILTGATSYESFSAMATALNYTTYE